MKQAEQSEVEASGARSVVARNASVAMLARLLYLLTRLAVPPLVLAYADLADYALWSAAFVLIMYVGLADAGFANVYVRFVASFHARGDVGAISRLLSTGVTALVIIATVLFLALVALLPELLSALQVAEDRRELASHLILGAAGIFLLDLSLGAYCYLLHGLQRIAQEQRIAVVGYLLELVVIVALLITGYGIYSLLLAFALRYSWSLLAFRRLAYQSLPGLRVSAKLFDRGMLRHFLGYGSRVQLSQLCSTALQTVDRIAAGALFGPTAIALFELGNKLPIAAASIPSIISRVTMPEAARLVTVDDTDGLQRLFYRSSRYAALLCALPLAFLAAFAAPVSTAWLGTHDSELSSLPVLLALAALTAQLHTMTGPGSAVFRARGEVFNEFVYHALRVLALLAGLPLAFHLLGRSPTSLAMGLCGAGSVAALAYTQYNLRRLSLSSARFLKECLLPATLPYLTAMLLASASADLLSPTAPRVALIVTVLACLMLYLLITAPLLWHLCMTDDERTYLRTRCLDATPARFRQRTA